MPGLGQQRRRRHQYWTSAIPAGNVSTGDTIEYYFKITFANADTTWLGSTNNLGSIKYAAAADAQAHPFTFTYAAAIPPAPVVLPAAATNATDFTAAWQASAGATNYFLDVAQTAASLARPGQ
jgi:hypothetical protein